MATKKLTMNPELKEKWLGALRSPLYKQGRGNLRTKNDEFCCLGVLCDIIDNKGWIESSINQNFRWKTDNSQEYALSLPPTVAAKAQISRREEQQLMDMNDDGKSFSEIADFIEKTL